MRRYLLPGIWAAVALVGLCVARADKAAEHQRTFDGLSSELNQTQIVATLDIPVEKGKNVIWCASFLASWKVLQEKYAKGGVELEGAENYASRLNDANDPRGYIPENCLYANAGFVDKGV